MSCALVLFLLTFYFTYFLLFIICFCLLLFHLLSLLFHLHFIFIFIFYFFYRCYSFLQPFEDLITHILKSLLAFALISCEFTSLLLTTLAIFLSFFLSPFSLAIVFLPSVLEFRIVDSSWTGGLFCLLHILSLALSLYPPPPAFCSWLFLHSPQCQMRPQW